VPPFDERDPAGIELPARGCSIVFGDLPSRREMAPGSMRGRLTRPPAR
jgi:hypothetical protein